MKSSKKELTQWGEEVKEGAKQFSAGAAPVARTAGNSFGHAIGVLFKAFFLFIAGVIVFALFIALMAIIFSGIGVFPLKNFVLEGFWQNTMAWGTLILFLGVPIVASVIWLIRRISGVKSKNNYLGYIFGTLWIFGWVSVITLAGLISRQFKRTGNIKEEISITQPSNNKLLVDLGETYGRYYDMAWFDDDGGNDLPALSADEDSMLLNTVRIRIVKSKDSLYHTSLVKLSRGNTPLQAEQTASQINFPIKQNDSILYLPKGFGISKESKFRNQQVLVVIEVPVGKAIRIDHSIDWYAWFNINSSRRGLNIDIDDDYFNYNDYSWRNDIWYVMTDKGLERMDKKDRDSNDKDASDESNDWNKDENKSGGEYRYRKDGDTIDIKIDKKDTSVNIKLRTELLPKEGEDENKSDAIIAKKVKSSSYGKSLISVLDLLKVGS